VDPTDLTLPQPWLDTMHRLWGVLPSAILAGGALRDLDNDREVKDIDVFYVEEGYPVCYLDDGLAKIGYQFHNQCGGTYMTGAAAEVDATSVYRSEHGLPDLNLIRLMPWFNQEKIIGRVDFGICQIGFDRNGIHMTDAYRRDKADRCFTLTRADCVEGVKRSLNRFDRLRQKYHDWELRWPPEAEALVTNANILRLVGA